MVFEDASQMVQLATDLGIDNPEDFVYNIMTRLGNRVTLSSFILHCVQYLIIENKKLKEEIDWMKQGKNS